MKEKCIVCSLNKGRRVCKLKNKELICPVCCAKMRTLECEGCFFYAQAQQFTKEKLTPQKSKPFTMRIDPQVEELADQALMKIEKGDMRAGEKIISDLLTKHPDLAIVQYAMGVICALREQHNTALYHFDNALAINPYFVEAWFNKAAAHQKKLELSETIMAYRKVVELGDATEDFVRHAKNFLLDFEKSVKKESGLTLDRYLESKDIFDQAFSWLEKGEWGKALQGFQKVVAMNPKHTQSHGNIGICYAHLGRKQEALAALDKAIELDPKYEPALLNRLAVEALKEGEKLSSVHFKTIDYSKDYSLEKKSLLRDVLKKFKMGDTF